MTEDVKDDKSYQIGNYHSGMPLTDRPFSYNYEEKYESTKDVEEALKPMGHYETLQNSSSSFSRPMSESMENRLQQVGSPDGEINDLKPPTALSARPP